MWYGVYGTGKFRSTIFNRSLDTIITSGKLVLLLKN